MAFVIIIIVSFYTYHYVAASRLPMPLTAGFLIFALLTACIRAPRFFKQKNSISLWWYIVAFPGAFVVLNSLALNAYEPQYLLNNILVVPFYTVLHLVKLVLFYSIFTLILFLLGDFFVRKVFHIKISLAAYSGLAIASGGILVTIYYYLLALMALVYPISMALPMVMGLLNRQGLRVIMALGKRIMAYLTKPIPLWSIEHLFWITLLLALALTLIQNGWILILDGDSIAHYFNLPNHIIEHHQLLRFPYWSISDALVVFSFLYVPILWFGQTMLNHVSLYFFLLTLPLLYTITSHFFDRDVRWLSLWLFAVVPVNWSFLVLSPRIDYMTIFFVMTGLALVLHFSKEASRRTAMLAGIILGFAVSIKFNLILLVPGLFVGFVYFGWRARVPRAWWSYLALCCMAAFVTFVIFNFRTFYYYGNFIYPYNKNALYSMVSMTEYTPDERAYLEEFLRQSAYYETYMGPGFTLRENIQHFFQASLVHPSFNYGTVLMLALVAALFFRRQQMLERVFTIAIIVTMITWYVLIKSEMHYINFLIPLMAVVGAGVLARISSVARTYTLLLMSFLLLINLGGSGFSSSLFIARAANAATMLKFPSYIF